MRKPSAVIKIAVYCFDDPPPRAGVYMICGVDSGGIRPFLYAGQSNNVAKRCQAHQGPHGHNDELGAYIAVYGTQDLVLWFISQEQVETCAGLTGVRARRAVESALIFCMMPAWNKRIVCQYIDDMEYDIDFVYDDGILMQVYEGQSVATPDVTHGAIGTYTLRFLQDAFTSENGQVLKYWNDWHKTVWDGQTELLALRIEEAEIANGGMV